MSLLIPEKFVKVIKPTGYGAFGEIGANTEGAEFMAQATYNASNPVVISEKSRQVANWTVTIYDGTDLSEYDIIKRVSDGLQLKVEIKSKNVQTPKSASFQFTQAFCNEVMPNE